MFSKRAEPRSITSRLVIYFTLAAALLLSCGLGVLYLIFVRHAIEEDKAVLVDKISVLQADLNRTGDPQRFTDELKFLREGDRASYWVRLIDRAGVTVAETPGMSELLPANVFPHPSAEQLSVASPDYRAGGKLFAIAASSENVGNQAYTIQVAQDRSGDERFMKEFATLLVVVLGFGIVASAGIALTATRKGLQPITEMARSLKRVEPKRLHERIPPAGWPRELQPLAVAFDEMLDRLEDSFTRLSQFSGDLAHALRTPIANIRGEGEGAVT